MGGVADPRPALKYYGSILECESRTRASAQGRNASGRTPQSDFTLVEAAPNLTHRLGTGVGISMDGGVSLPHPLSKREFWGVRVTLMRRISRRHKRNKRSI